MNEVKVYDADGNLKKIISGEEISKKFWAGLTASATTLKRTPKPLKPKKCKGCKTEYIPKRPNNTFCSRECQQVHHRKQIAAPKLEIICAKCGKLFIGNQSNRWCNNPCAYNVEANGTIKWKKNGRKKKIPR